MKLPVNIGILFTGIYLPENFVDIDVFVKKGLLSEEEAQKSGFKTLTKAGENETVIHMSHMAAKRASADICNKLNMQNTAFIDLYQGCNGIMSAIDYSISKFISDDQIKNILIVAGYVLDEKISDRINFDYGAFYGDAACAFVLQRDCKHMQSTFK